MSDRHDDGQLNTKLAVVVFGVSDGEQSGEAMALREAGGRPVLAHVVGMVREIVPADAVFVVADRDAEKIRTLLAPSGVTVIDASGIESGDSALATLRTALDPYERALLVPAGMACLRAVTLEDLTDAFETSGTSMTVLTGQAIESEVVSLPSAVCSITREALLPHLGRLLAPAIAEEVTGGIADALLAAREKIRAVRVEDDAELDHVHSIAALVRSDREIRRRTTHRLMKQGVTIFLPETCVIDVGVEVGADTVIEPFVQLLGTTKIGSGTRIRSYTVIENCTVGSEVIIRQSCVLADSSIADHADIGPFARMRPGCEIGEHVHVGNFVEVKKSKLHAGVKAGHLAYLGDSTIGARTNIGAGVITCNYDGERKHPTHIGEGAFIGSDSTLVAPVTIGDGAYIGAGSCVTKNVPADSLAVARAHQVTKEGWATARRARKKE